MKSNLKKRIWKILKISVILTIIFLFGYYGYFRPRVKESMIYDLMTAYQENRIAYPLSENINSGKDTAESLFLKGIDAFTIQNYEEARRCFNEALDYPGRDPALPIYLSYYLNECCFFLEGKGDFELISQTLDAMRMYKPLSSDARLVRDMLNTIIFDENGKLRADIEVINFIQDYLAGRDDLSLTMWSILTNRVGMLYYLKGEFAQSIPNFYTVEIKLGQNALTPELYEEMMYAKEYIANIYYLFDDYESAIEIYQQLINSDKTENVLYKFRISLSLAGAYMGMGDFNSTEEIIEMMEKLLPQLDSSMRAEAEACLHNILAKVYLAENNYSKANEYIELAEEYYEKNNNDSLSFLVSLNHVKIARCKYLIYEEELESAEAILTEMLQQKETFVYGMEETIYELLIEIYQKTESKSRLTEYYEQLLNITNNKRLKAELEYLNFSIYYRDATRLKEENQLLNRNNSISLFMIMLFVIILLLVLLMLCFLHQTSKIDHLTRIYNRKKLGFLSIRYKYMGTPSCFSVILLDVDYFKKYNDTYGHIEGDKVLKEIAGVIKASVRSCDLVIRYGGEEFLIILRGIEPHTVRSICYRIGICLEKLSIPHSKSPISSHVTLSMGACYQKEAATYSFMELIKYADECLYQSKKDGRNCFTLKIL